MPTTETSADDVSATSGAFGQAMRARNERIPSRAWALHAQLFGRTPARDHAALLAALKAGRIKASIQAHP